MEMVDVLNEDGTFAGYTVSKEEVHERGLWHRTVHVWLLNSNKEILIQIKPEKMTGKLGVRDMSLAGHLSAGDSSILGAIREFEEELGVRLEAEDLIKIGEIKQEGYRTRHTENKEWCEIFVVQKDIKLNEFKLDPEEVESVKYISIDELTEWAKYANDNFIVHANEFNLLVDYLNK